MKILVTGASGMIGRAAAASLHKNGHEVTELRRAGSGPPPYWNLEKHEIVLRENDRFDAVVHLAGESISGGRWTEQRKDRILNSRVAGTRLLSEYFSKAEHRPRVFISGSAVGFYGDRGDEKLDEASGNGAGFLAEVCRQWEELTQPASACGIRVSSIRLGMVLSPHAGALAEMLFPFKTGLGGIIGKGDQFVSWITLRDAVNSIEFILENENLSGPVNLTSPQPVTNRQFTKELAGALRRPSLMRLPGFMAKLIFGEMAQELLLASSRVLPRKLDEAGYCFRDPDLHEVMMHFFNPSHR